MAFISEAERKSYQDDGRRDCLECLNPFEPDACTRAAYQQFWGSDWNSYDPPQVFLAIVIEYAWGWNWALQTFKESWIGVPLAERKP